jgi:integral membrane protein
VEKKRLAFTLYRVLAYVAGIFLLLLAFVAMPAKYLIGETAPFSLVSAPAGMERLFGEDSILMMAVAIPHGYIYMLYVLIVIWVALERRWGAGRTLGVAIAGTIPFVGLIVEHRLAKAEKAAEHQASQVEEVPAAGG